MVIGQANNIHIQGILDALSNFGIKTAVWNHTENSIFNLIDSFKAQILIIDFDQYIPDIAYLAKDQNIKIVLIGNDIPKDLFNINKPDLLCYSHMSHKQLSVLDNKKIEHYCLSNASNLIRFKGKKAKEYNLGIVFLSYKVIEEDDFLKKIFEKTQGPERFTIIGPIPFQLPNYIGNVTDEELANIIASSNAIITYKGTHANNVWANGGKVMSINGKFPKESPEKIKKRCIEENYILHVTCMSLFKDLINKKVSRK